MKFCQLCSSERQLRSPQIAAHIPAPIKCHLQGVFLLVPPMKVLSVRLHSKSHQKSSKCRKLLTGRHF